MKKIGLVVILVLSLLNPAVGKQEGDGWLDWAWDNKCTIVGSVAAAAVAPVAVPAAVTGLGFTAAGIQAGSWAAYLMSATATANGGGVIAGSIVATLQSIGTAGLGLGGTAAAAGVGAGAGAIVGKATCTENCRNNEN